MLSTRNVKETGGSGKINAKIQPGNHSLKIHSVELKEGYNFQQTRAYEIILNVETAPVEGDFEGFLVHPDNPTGPRYLGQVGRLKFQYHNFQDGVTKKGTPVNRDNNILSSIVRMANVLGCREELDDTIDAAAISRIEELMPVATQVFRGKWFDACVSGRAYKDKNGYVAYELFMPYAKGAMVPFEPKGAKSGNLQQFDAAVHIIPVKEDKPVAGFEPAGQDMDFTPPPAAKANADFDL